MMMVGGSVVFPQNTRGGKGGDEGERNEREFSVSFSPLSAPPTLKKKNLMAAASIFNDDTFVNKLSMVAC